MSRRPAFPSMSLLSASLGRRLALASFAAALLWLTILWALN